MHRGVADSVPELLKTEEDVAERAVVGEEFNLTRAIKDNVVIYILMLAVVTIFNINTSPTFELFQALLQPLKVVLQLFESI
jgi:hypothetical protein